MQRVVVEIDGRSWSIPFMLDTGADVTILQPRDANLVLGLDLFEIHFDNDQAAVRVSGVGIGGIGCVVRQARYALPRATGGFRWFDAPILIAEPIPFHVSTEGNWTKVSTLGRDILHRAKFGLDYAAKPPVRLELSD